MKSQSNGRPKYTRFSGILCGPLADKNVNWYEGTAPGYPSGNNGLEATMPTRETRVIMNISVKSSKYFSFEMAHNVQKTLESFFLIFKFIPNVFRITQH